MSKRLVDLIKTLMDKADDTFFECANKADSSRRQQIYFDAMRDLRLRRATLESEIQRVLKETFDGCFATSIAKLRPLAELDSGPELSLVGTDEVESDLATTNFIEGIRTRCKHELFALDQRVGHLLSDAHLGGVSNPFGPEAIGHALGACCRQLEADIEARITFLKLGDRCLGPGLAELYRAMNDFLVREDVLPKLSVAGGSGAGMRTRVTIETDAGSTEALGHDVFSTLQQLLAPGLPLDGIRPAGGARTGAAAGGAGIGGGPGGMGLPIAGGAGTGGLATGTGTPGAGGFPGGGGFGGGSTAGSGAGASGSGQPSSGGAQVAGGTAGTGAPGGVAGGQGGLAGGATGGFVSTATFLTNLTDLQHGQLPGPMMGQLVGLDPAQFQTGTVNVLRTLRESGAFSELNQTDTLTLDIVSLLFDYILDDPSIPDRIKALIGRLQIPMLKVALMDKDLFSKKTHPARQLLDGLASASVGWSEGTSHSDALYEKIQYIVYRVVEEFDKDLGLFSQLLAELNTFLAQDERESQLQAERAANSLRTKERIVLAKFAVDEAVKSRLDGVETREFIRQFVRDFWRQQLIVTYVEQGPTSEAWTQQLAVIDELLWSVQAKTTPDEKRELTTRLPKMLKLVKAGMRELEMDQAVCSKFLTMLASVHVVSVKQVEESTLAERRLTQRDAEFEQASEPPSEEVFVKQALDRLFARNKVETADLDIDFEALEAEVATAPVEDEPVAQDEFLEKVMELDLGDWVEFTLPDDSVVRSRFTWISPATGRYLFTDRQGHKAFDLSLHALCENFRGGKAVRFPGQPDPLFERAIAQLMERMERQVA